MVEGLSVVINQYSRSAIGQEMERERHFTVFLNKLQHWMESEDTKVQGLSVENFIANIDTYTHGSTTYDGARLHSSRFDKDGFLSPFVIMFSETAVKHNLTAKQTIELFCTVSLCNTAAHFWEFCQHLSSLESFPHNRNLLVYYIKCHVTKHRHAQDDFGDCSRFMVFINGHFDEANIIWNCMNASEAILWARGLTSTVRKSDYINVDNMLARGTSAVGLVVNT